MVDFAAAEYSVIGCLLIDERCLPGVRRVLPTAEAFASDACRRAYTACLSLRDAGKAVDPVTVGRETGLERSFLQEAMELAPTCGGAEDYAEAVLDGFRRRQLSQIADTLREEAMAPGMDCAQALNEARSRLDALARQGEAASVQTPTACLGDFLTYRTEVCTGKRLAVKSGFPSLDLILGGFARGGLYVVAARPGVGKSALGIAMADMLARDRKVLYASLEMTREELNARRVAAFSDAPLSYSRLLHESTTEAEDQSLLAACSRLNERKLWLWAGSRLSVAELGMLARNEEAEVVMVDYLGLLSGSDPKAGEYDRITQISGDLKRLAKGLPCVVIALCQLNRESAAAGSGENLPKLSQLRSSGAIEQDADGVLLLHRPEYGQRQPHQSQETPQQFYVNVAKNRHGRTGTAELYWYAPVNRFEDRGGGKWTVKSWA